MNTPESQLLKKALDGEFRTLLSTNFDPDLLVFPYNVALHKLGNFYYEHGELPSHARLCNLCGIDVPIADSAKHTITVYWEQLLTVSRKKRLEDVLNEMANEYNQGPAGEVAFIESAINKLMRVADLHHNVRKVSSLGDMGSEMHDDYLSAESGNIPGIPIAPELKILTGSLVKLEPSHITTIVARTGVGKTWLALILAVHAAIQNHRIVIASMEMARRDIARRMLALAFKINFNSIKKGLLKGEEREKYLKSLHSMKESDGFWKNILILEPGEIRSVAAVTARARSFGAELVVADAFYMYPGNQEERWQRIESNLNAVRSATLMTGQHWLLTAQFNKRAKGIKSSDEFAVGGSDSFNQDSNNIVHLIQRKQDKRNKAVILVLGKGRDCEIQIPWLHWWNFMTMDWNPIAIYSPGDGMSSESMKSKL
jgi:hypothetical protein